MRRVNLSISEIVDDKAKAFAEKNNMSKSALFSVAVTEYMAAMEALPSFKADLQSQLDELRAQVELLGK